MALTKNIVTILLIILFTVTAYAGDEKGIFFAISPMASPASTLSSYNDFVKYLSDKTGEEIELKQRRTYSEVNSLLRTGVADFALTCTGAYLDGREDFGLELLVTPVMNGKASYNSYVITNKESGIDDFSKLKGKVYAYTDPLSFTGRLYTLFLLHQLGEKSEGYFKKTFYTSSHEKSIESVAFGLADGASVDSLIFNDMKRLKSPAIDKVRIIKVSPAYGIPPLVVSPSVNKTIKDKIVNILLNMSDDPAGKKILRDIMVDKYVLPDPAIYNNAAKLRDTVLLK